MARLDPSLILVISTGAREALVGVAPRTQRVQEAVDPGHALQQDAAPEVVRQ